MIIEDLSKVKKRYSIIYADPPWSYIDKIKSLGGGAESHYACMKADELKDLKIPARKDSLLFLWCTYPQLGTGLETIKAWGFTYRTVGFTWVKTNKNGSLCMGMGRYTRANAEICLLGKRGKGVKRKNAGIRNTQLYRREQHSKKPDAFRDQIVELCGNISRIELFARQEFDGWDAWGNEV